MTQHEGFCEQRAVEEFVSMPRASLQIITEMSTLIKGKQEGRQRGKQKGEEGGMKARQRRKGERVEKKMRW